MSERGRGWVMEGGGYCSYIYMHAYTPPSSPPNQSTHPPHHIPLLYLVEGLVPLPLLPRRRLLRRLPRLAQRLLPALALLHLMDAGNGLVCVGQRVLHAKLSIESSHSVRCLCVGPPPNPNQQTYASRSTRTPVRCPSCPPPSPPAPATPPFFFFRRPPLPPAAPAPPPAGALPPL